MVAMDRIGLRSTAAQTFRKDTSNGRSESSMQSKGFCTCMSYISQTAITYLNAR